MTSKKTNLMAFAAAISLSLPLAIGTAFSQERSLVLMSSGGVLLEAQKKAFIEPFEEATGIRVVTVAPVDFAKIQTQVKANRVEIDVVEWAPEFAIRFCGTVLDKITDEIDMSAYNPDYVSNECGVPQSTFTHPFFYNKKTFSGDVPQTWADFFDTEKFPGKRAVWNSGFGTNFEKALIADGVEPENLYPLDLERAASARQAWRAEPRRRR